jgi:cyclase
MLDKSHDAMPEGKPGNLSLPGNVSLSKEASESLESSKNGLCRRIIPCLDVANGRTVKGVKFTEIRDVGDPVELALAYEAQGADELVFLDITASHEERKTTLDLVKRVAASLSIPFTVGGGISDLADVLALLQAGADKVSVNSAAVKRPELIAEIRASCGAQCCVLAIDARRMKQQLDQQLEQQLDQQLDQQSGATQLSERWEVLTHGGRKSAGLDALEWGRKGVSNGAGEILLTSWDNDGTQSGFDLALCRAFSENLTVPIIASGGARDAGSFIDVFKIGKADAALAATIFHDSIWSIGKIKDLVSQAGIQVRLEKGLAGSNL